MSKQLTLPTPGEAWTDGRNTRIVTEVKHCGVDVGVYFYVCGLSGRRLVTRYQWFRWVESGGRREIKKES